MTTHSSHRTSAITHPPIAITHNYDVFHGALGDKRGRVFSKPDGATAVYAAGVLLDSLSDPEDTARLDFVQGRIIDLALLTGRRPVVSFTTRRTTAPDVLQALICIGDEFVFACVLQPLRRVERELEEGRVVVEGLSLQVSSTSPSRSNAGPWPGPGPTAMTHGSIESDLRTWCDRALPAVKNPRIILAPRVNNEDHFVVFDRRKSVYWAPGAKGYTSDLVQAGVFTSGQVVMLRTEDGRDEIIGFDEAIRRRVVEVPHHGLRVIDCLDIGLESEDPKIDDMDKPDHDSEKSLPDELRRRLFARLPLVPAVVAMGDKPGYPTEQEIDDWWVKTVPKDPHGCSADIHQAVRFGVDWERIVTRFTVGGSVDWQGGYPTEQEVGDWWVKTVPKDPHGCGEIHQAVRWAVDWERIQRKTA